MSRPTNISVSESLEDLKSRQKVLTLPKQKRMQMLVLIKTGSHTTVEGLGGFSRGYTVSNFFCKKPL